MSPFEEQLIPSPTVKVPFLLQHCCYGELLLLPFPFHLIFVELLVFIVSLVSVNNQRQIFLLLFV